MKIYQFRLLVIVSAASYVSSIMYGYMIHFSEGTAMEKAFRWNTYDAIYIPHPTILIIIILLTSISLVSLFFFSRAGRLVCTTMILIISLLSIFTGVSILTPYQAFLGIINCLSFGGVLVGAWFTDLSTYFVESKDRKE